jgi:outer membrane protein
MSRCLLVVVAFVSISSNATVSMGSTALNLREAIDIALESNVALRQASNQAYSAGLSVSQAKADFLPSLQLSSNATLSDYKALDTESGLYEGQDSERLTSSVSLNLNLFTGFGRLASLRQSGYELDASDYTVERMEQAVTYETASRFIQAAAYREMIRVYQENLEAQRQQLDRVKAFYDAGNKPIADLFQQQAETARAELGLLESERDFEISRLQLMETLGLDPSADLKIIGPETDDLGGFACPYQEGKAVTRALADRPDLASQQSQVAAALQGVKVARANYWPTVSLSFGVGTGYSNSMSELYGFSDQYWDNNVQTDIGLSISLPIFDRMRTRTDVGKSQIQLETAQLELEGLKHSIKREVLQAFEDLHMAEKQVDVVDAQVRFAEESLRSYQKRYDVGASTLAEVTQARATFLEARQSQVSARYDLLLTHMNLAYCVGNTDLMISLVDDVSRTGSGLLEGDPQ